MDICPNCGANTDGLISYCDCCGCKLNVMQAVFVARIHEYVGTSDVGTVIMDSVKKLNGIITNEMLLDIDKIIIQSYCYPSHLIAEMCLRNQTRIYKKKREAVITILFPYEEQDASSQLEMIKNEAGVYLQNRLIELYERLHYPNESELAQRTKLALNDMQ